MTITGSKLVDRQRVRNKVYDDVVNIASGASLSEAIHVGNLSLVGVYTPSPWTSADVTFQVSHDNVTWYEMRDVNGNYYTLPTVGGGAYRPVAPADFIGPRWLKVRSGTLAAPVNQGGARVIPLVFREI